MATETNMGTIHLFPSVSSYNTNKTSVSTNDLALVPTPRIPIETYRDGHYWWVKYSDGWCEQGCKQDCTASRSSYTEVSFNIPFKDANNSLSANVLSLGRTNYGLMWTILSWDASGFKIAWYGNGGSDLVNGVVWTARGYFE